MSIADKITSTLVNSNISSALQTSSVNDTLSGDNTAVTSYSSMSETPPLCGCSLCRGDKAENMLEDGQQTDSAYMIDGPQYASTYYTRGIDSGYEWTGTSGGKTVINYKFWDSLPGYYSSSSSESNNFQPFTSSQKAAALKIINMLESVADVDFREVSSESSVDIGFAQANLGSGIGAWAYYPGSSGKSGDVWTNNYYSATKSVGEGGYGFLLLLHEIGHAMGLKHTFDGSYKLSGSEDLALYRYVLHMAGVFGELYALRHRRVAGKIRGEYRL